MQPTPKTRKTITLSPETVAALKLPLRAGKFGNSVFDAAGNIVIKVYSPDGRRLAETEIAAFVADLVNAALMPAEPVTVEPETEAELRQAVC